jgi:hypothetical protein
MRAVLAIALALVAGCASADPVEQGLEPLAAEPYAAAASPSPSTTPVLLRPPEEPAPALALTGEDVGAVFRSIAAYRDWLFRHPDPVGLDAIYEPACPCHAEERARLEAYAAAGRWWTGTPPAVTDVRVVDDADPNLVTLRVTTVQQGPTELVDATGAVHEALPPGQPYLTDVVLRRDGRRAPWRVRAIAYEGPAPGATP